jgi:hypothetical protein
MPIRSTPPAGPGRARAAWPHRIRRRIAATGFAAALAALAAPAQADICKYADPDGNIHYSNVPPEKGWKRISCTVGDNGAQQPAGSGSAGAARKTPTPAGFPRVDGETQKVRDDMRRKVLAEELASEQKLLAEARTAYADGAPPPLPEERTDAEKYRVRIGKLKQTVTVHERNIEALKKEIALVK